MPFPRRRKGGSLAPPPPHPKEDSRIVENDKEEREKEEIKKRREKEDEIRRLKKKWSCIDSCCWFVGFICCTWWFLLFMYNAMPASFPQFVTEAITGPLPDPPGVKLQKEGLKVKHPVVFVPGIVTGGLELWEGHQCAEGLFRKRLWGGTFGELYKRPLCWVEHMSLDNETGLDPPGIRVRPVSGLVAADYFAPGYFVWAVLIANLARIGYEEKTMYMAAYDWRIAFQNTEVRDQSLSRMKSNIELMVATNGGNKVVVIPHSMGALYFLHFMKWVEAPAPMGGGGGSDWCAKHIKAVMNIGGPFFRCSKSCCWTILGRSQRCCCCQHVMRMTRTWDTTLSMIPKGGDTIWGNLDWSPEDGYNCTKKPKGNITNVTGKSGNGSLYPSGKSAHYGRIISFGKGVADAPSSKIERMEFRGATKGHNLANATCQAVWTEYHEMGIPGIKAVADYKVYTAESVIDLLHYVAPKMMKRGDAHYSYGIADDLDDPKYNHYKYWSNPLETRLPYAPDMEIFSLYGVGIPTERAYIYKQISTTDCYIPFQIDTLTDGTNENSCLKSGVYNVDGDETVPVLSAGYMCAKGWKGRTRFNPSGMKTYIKEYDHAPPANLLEGRGTQSGAHVDIMGNFALIEDIIRVAAGATGEELGGNRVYSDIYEWSERIDLKL
ncbi:Phospholipid:diacylglycerol acyltransferase 1 [Bienertia sinuspersici]